MYTYSASSLFARGLVQGFDAYASMRRSVARNVDFLAKNTNNLYLNVAAKSLDLLDLGRPVVKGVSSASQGFMNRVVKPCGSTMYSVGSDYASLGMMFVDGVRSTGSACMKVLAKNVNKAYEIGLRKKDQAVVALGKGMVTGAMNINTTYSQGAFLKKSLVKNIEGKVTKAGVLAFATISDLGNAIRNAQPKVKRSVEAWMKRNPNAYHNALAIGSDLSKDSHVKTVVVLMAGLALFVAVRRALGSTP